MSLVQKMDEISVFISENNLDLLFLSETWLKNTVEDTHVFKGAGTTGARGGSCMPYMLLKQS